MTETEDGNSNDYLDLRQRNIERNEAKLRELGLLRPKPKPKFATRYKPDLKKKLNPTCVRRSSRRIGRPESYKDVSIGSVQLSTRKPHSDDTSEYFEDLKPELQGKKTARGAKAENDAIGFPANSARGIHLDVGRLVHARLGKAMEITGKAAVVEEAAQQFSAGQSDYSIINGISFNKYCGVQEWNGNRVFLWVNLGGPQTGYVNNFAEEGKKNLLYWH